MYIYKAVTISSTAIIATTTVSPTPMPGPSDTPLFSVVHHIETTASVSPTAVIPPPIIIAPMLTVTATATATVTMRPPYNGSPYPAFNASNYPQHNFTAPAYRLLKNETDMIPVMHSNCTNTQPVLYTAGNRSSDGQDTTLPTGAKNSTVKIICDGRNGKNQTKGSQGDDIVRAKNAGTPLPLPMLGAPSVDGTMPAERNRDKNNVDEDGNMVRRAHSDEANVKRSEVVAASDERVPAYVKALEKGPII